MSNSDEIPPCDQEVYDKGVGIYVGELSKHMAEHICKGLTEVLQPSTGVKVDWHYMGGRVIMRVLLPEAKQDQNSAT